MRVVSLIASSTEIVCALGRQEWLVGRSHECDYPPGVLRLPVCTETKFRADGTSYEIDQRIKAILQEGLSVYRVLGDRLRELRPDVILTQIQCEVCAVSRRDVEEATCEWLGTRPRIVSLNPNSLEDIWRDILSVSDALEERPRGELLVSRLKGRIAGVARAASRLKERPRVAVVEWIEPLMAAGNWMPELVALAGGTNLFGEARRHSPWMTWEDLIAKDPEVILVTPCGFDIARTEKEMEPLTRRTDWNRLRAVREGRVYIADGNQYFNRPGPRIVESLEILFEVLHPKAGSRAHEGTGWRSAHGLGINPL